MNHHASRTVAAHQAFHRSYASRGEPPSDGRDQPSHVSSSNRLHVSDHVETRSESIAKQELASLSSVYLDAGLPLEFAVRSAVADYALFNHDSHEMR